MGIGLWEVAQALASLFFGPSEGGWSDTAWDFAVTAAAVLAGAWAALRLHGAARRRREAEDGLTEILGLVYRLREAGGAGAPASGAPLPEAARLAVLVRRHLKAQAPQAEGLLAALGQAHDSPEEGPLPAPGGTREVVARHGAAIEAACRERLGLPAREG